MVDILVLGSTGYVGSQLVEQLVSENISSYLAVFVFTVMLLIGV